MSLLVPLYLAGLMALGLPLLLHLVRRTPRGRQEFSSLMFLSPAAPRLTHRSRLDQLLLLALRLAALALLAFAFARPFLRETALLAAGDLPGRRVAILVDVSASLRRADLWKQAVGKVEDELRQLTPGDDVALYIFSDHVTTLAGFDPDQAGPRPGKPQILRQLLQGVQPGWRAGDLGAALLAVAAEIDTATDAGSSAREPLIVVVSDFQHGSKIEALQGTDWPRRVHVVPRVVAAARPTNAVAQALPPAEGANDDPAQIRVRVANAADSTGSQFYLKWAGGPPPEQPGRELAVFVPPGQSRIVRLPRGVESQMANQIQLRGDDHDFDNRFCVAPRIQRDVAVLYVGTDGDAPRGLARFLRLAGASDPMRKVDLQIAPDPPRTVVPRQPSPQLIVVSRLVAPAEAAALKDYAGSGGTLLLVLAHQELAGLASLVLDLDEPAALPAADYLLLGDVDFSHRLFAPFADPRYSDFTKIHFWRHCRLNLRQPSSARVLARFDNGDPAVLEQTLGAGRAFVLAGGWHPDDSQLALSSKFVPLVGGLLDVACGDSPARFDRLEVGARLVWPEFVGDAPIIVTLPDRRTLQLPPHARELTGVDQPGEYDIAAGAARLSLAVNIAASESDTAPMDLSQLEQRGVRLGPALTRAERLDRARQQRDTELESRQRIWRWLIAAALSVLIVETFYAGWAERRIVQQEAGS